MVLWGSHGSLGSSIGFGKFSFKLKSSIQLPQYILGVVVGIILSDGWIQISSFKSKNARLRFTQSLAHFEYLWCVFLILSPYCSSYPQFTIRYPFGKPTSGFDLSTRSLPCFTQLHSLFYLNSVKVIPDDIYDLLTPPALAHWIMGGGSSRSSGMILCTNSFTIKETVHLMNVLMIKYRLNCTLTIHNKKEPMIYIRSKSMPLLRSIVIPHMHPSMLYKIQ